jgi:protoporphyrinogen oxidase
MKKKVLVLGGGASGLSTAWRLAENKIPVDLIESSTKVGGLASTVEHGKYYFDYGPHYFFSERSEIVRKVMSIYKKYYKHDMLVKHRDVLLSFHGKFLKYPLSIKNILFEISIYDSIHIALSYFKSQAKEYTKQLVNKFTYIDNFETWAKLNFGEYLYKIFFRPYTEQFWGIKCNKLAPKTLPTSHQLSLIKTLKLVFHKKIAKKNASLAERESSLLLRYPPKGIGGVTDSIAKEAKRLGVRFNLGYCVKEIKRDKSKSFVVTALKNGKIKRFKSDFIVSTIPLIPMLGMLKPIPPKNIIKSSKELDFLSFIILYIVVDEREILPSSYLYFVGRPYNRISEINKFSPKMCPPDENMIGIEISCKEEDDVWKYSKEQLFEYCIKYLEKDKIIKRDEVKKIFVLKARYAYPIFFKDYGKNLKPIQDYIDSIPNFKVIGRVGEYEYIDIDQCIAKSFNLVDNITPKLKGKQ